MCLMLCAPLDWQYAEFPSSARDAVLCSLLVRMMWDKKCTRFSCYKNILYKNIEDEMGQKVKNILRICSSWTFAYKVKNTLCKNTHPNGKTKKQKLILS